MKNTIFTSENRADFSALTEVQPSPTRVNLNILLVEKDNALGGKLITLLAYSGFTITLSTNGFDAILKLKTQLFNFIIIDTLALTYDEIEIVKEIRKFNTIIPIVILANKEELKNVNQCLYLGANEILEKPFKNEHLISRIKDIIRNYNSPVWSSDSKIQLFSIIIYILKQKIKQYDVEYHLTATEMSLLLLFVKFKNHLLPREIILERIWHNNTRYTSRTLDVYINRLRRILKIEDDVKIKTVHGKGYIFLTRQ